MIVKRRKTMAPCEETTVFYLANTLVRLNRLNGEVDEETNMTESAIWSDEINSDYSELLKTPLYRPIDGYTWEELRPQEEINVLLATSAAQAEILELLSVPLYGSDGNGTGGAVVKSSLAEELVARGLRSLHGFLQTPFHWWIGLTCSFCNGYFLVWTLHKIWLRCCRGRSRRRRRRSHRRSMEEPQPGAQQTNWETPMFTTRPQMPRGPLTRRPGTLRRQYRPYSTPARLTEEEIEARNRLTMNLRRRDDGDNGEDVREMSDEVIPVARPPSTSRLPPPPPPPMEMQTFHVVSATPGPDICIEMQEGSM
jgi:hypothetical protein